MDAFKGRLQAAEVCFSSRVLPQRSERRTLSGKKKRHHIFLHCPQLSRNLNRWPTGFPFFWVVGLERWSGISTSVAAVTRRSHHIFVDDCSAKRCQRSSCQWPCWPFCGSARLSTRSCWKECDLQARTSVTNVYNKLHTVQSYSFQVPRHADAVELKPTARARRECTYVFSSSSPLSLLIPGRNGWKWCYLVM